ncbi:hypothetical protein AeRB84_020101 [Aphanomyces euteiches]|nr:hypothetical protein AeRB84_020101 [Aphanomyces euteiches]
MSSPAADTAAAATADAAEPSPPNVASAKNFEPSGPPEEGQGPTSSPSTMNPHKSPGIDGFLAGFYQLHPALFGEILSIVFNHQLQEGIMLASQRWSAISLLFKGSDRRNPANYRPIALIPVEVKVLSRALAYHNCGITRWCYRYQTIPCENGSPWSTSL